MKYLNVNKSPLDNLSYEEIASSWKDLLQKMSPDVLVQHLFRKGMTIDSFAERNTRIKTDLLKELLVVATDKKQFMEFLQLQVPPTIRDKGYADYKSYALKCQDELLDAALALNVDNAKLLSPPSLPWMSSHMHTLIKHDLADAILVRTINIMTQLFSYSEDELPSYMLMSEKIIEKVKEHGVNIGDIYDSLNPYSLKTLQDFTPLLMKHMSATQFVGLVLSVSDKVYNCNAEGCQSSTNPENVIIKRNLTELAFKEEVNIHASIPHHGDDTILHALFKNKYFDIIQSLDLKEVEASVFFDTLDGSIDFSCLVDLLHILPTLFNKEDMKEYLQNNGVSRTLTENILKLWSLSEDYVKTVYHQQQILSKEEVSLLDTASEVSTLPSEVNFKNTYNFSAFDLAFTGKKMSLISNLSESNTNLVLKNQSSLSFIILLTDFFEDEEKSMEEFVKNLLSNLDSLDIILNENGETLFDNLPGDFQMALLNKTQNPLYYYFKENASLILPHHPAEEISIAISTSKDNWSIGPQSASHLIMQQHPHIKFYLVPLNILTKADSSFFDQFDGWINPGAGDNYPRDKTSFTLNDFELSIEVEHLYQAALNGTFIHNIPSWGICAGAQHLSLHHDGSLTLLPEPHQGSDHVMHFFEGTLSYFMTLSPMQQKQLLKNCIAPEVKFPGDTSHSFAAVPENLGNDIQLGAVSEGGLAMAYAHSNGLHYGTQFHPEHEYHKVSKDGSVNHAKMLFDNFIRLAVMHHDHRIGKGPDPLDYFAAVQERLEECMAFPTCEESMPLLLSDMHY